LAPLDLSVLPATGRLLGLDVGDKTVGVAVSDSRRSVASPVETIRRGKLAADVAALKKIAQERQAVGLVVGLPVNMDGSEGPRCQSVRAFAQSLDGALGLPMLLWDERLTTFAAEEVADDTGLRGKKRANMLDALAAAAFLQDALDTVARVE
jgi:putative Holliday junction resolvase